MHLSKNVRRKLQMNRTAKFRVLGLIGTLVLMGSQCGAVAFAQQHAGHPSVDGHGHVLDSRYNHGHYYPAVGASVRVLPEGYRPYYYSGRPYYFYAGVWYAPGGPGFLVVRPPVGVV